MNGRRNDIETFCEKYLGRLDVWSWFSHSGMVLIRPLHSAERGMQNLRKDPEYL